MEHGAQDAFAASLPPHLRAPAPTLSGESQDRRELVDRGAPGWETLGNALIRPSLDRPPEPDADGGETLAPPGFVVGALAPDGWVEVVHFLSDLPGLREPHDAFFVPLDPFSGSERLGAEVIVRRSVHGNSGAARTR